MFADVVGVVQGVESSMSFSAMSNKDLKKVKFVIKNGK